MMLEQNFFNAKKLSKQNKDLEAWSIFENLHANRPKAWWIAFESFKCIFNYLNNKTTKRKKNSAVIYTPEYKGNSYQSNLYINSESFGYDIIPFTGFNNSIELCEKISEYNNVLFHQHWLKEIYVKSLSLNHGLDLVDSYFSKLKAIKLFGVKIAWTVHNIVDHDLDPEMTFICKYAAKKIVDISDIIFVHCDRNKQELEEVLGIKLNQNQIKTLPHPLYNLMYTKEVVKPLEIDINRIQNSSKVLLFAGMIRPYKGLEEFLIVLNTLMEEIQKLNIHVIIAGEFIDKELYKKAEDIRSRMDTNITIIERRISDNELSYILSISSIMILPYRSILTSGSFFAATTFSLPVLAPNKGSFIDLISDKKTGFLYDGTTMGLERKLYDVLYTENIELKAIGANAFRVNSKNTIHNISDLFFRTIGGTND